jgi:hypothetical protein
MNLIRRIAVAMATLAGALLALTAASPAHASLPPPGGGAGYTPAPPVSYPCSPECSPLLDKHLILSHGHLTGTAYRVHTVVVGGMPGWQITLIAAVAALAAATIAVLADRIWTARRKAITAAA